MNQFVFLLAVSAVAFVIGRSVRDMLRKRPIREKKARRRGLHRFFAISAFIVIVAFILVISVVGSVMTFTEGLDFETIGYLIVIMAFGSYVCLEIVKYLKNL